MTKKLTLPEVLPRFAAYLAKNPNGGIFHVTLEDGNVEDIFVNSTLEKVRVYGTAEEIELAEILCALSFTQRTKLSREALGINAGGKQCGNGNSINKV